MKKYTWNFDDNGYFHDEFDTVEEALEEAHEYDPECEDVFVGELVPYKPCVCAWKIIDALTEDSDDECGDVADEWLAHVTQEEEKDLSDMLTAAFMVWEKKHKHVPNVCSVVNVKHYRMPTGEEVR